MGVFKPKKGSLERRRITRSRRAFGFRTDEVQVRLMKYRGKTRAFRPSKNGQKLAAEYDLLKLRIFHALFPENSLTPIGIAFTQEREKHNWGVVTNIIRKRSPAYKRHQQIFYSDRYFTKGKKGEAFERHEKFVKEVGLPLAYKIAKEAGICFDSSEVNICDVEGKPIFFEIRSIWPRACREFIERTVTNEGRKKRLLGFLEELEFIERKKLNRRSRE